MFLSPQTVETWFTVTDQGVLVEKGQLLRNQDDKVLNAFEIDRKAGQISFSAGKTQETVSSDVFESTSFPIVLMATEKMRHIGGVEVREINPKKVRWYQYHSPHSELIEINGKTYKTWKITRNKRGEPGRTQTFWLDRKNFRVPVKIVSIKGETKTTMMLIDG